MIEMSSIDSEDDGGDYEIPSPLVDSSESEDEAHDKRNKRQDDTESEGEDMTAETWIAMVQDIKRTANPSSNEPPENAWTEGLSKTARTY